MADTVGDILTRVKEITSVVSGLIRTEIYFPVYIDPQDYPVAIIWVADISESRRGLGATPGGATGGAKWIDYQVRCWLYWESEQPDIDTATWYTLVDNVRKAWRTHQTLASTPHPTPLVLRFGEDIGVELDAPINNGQITLFSAVISSTAREEVRA